MSLSIDFTGISDEQTITHSSAYELGPWDPAVILKDVLVSAGKLGKGQSDLNTLP